jgi:hypothetical protein
MVRYPTRIRGLDKISCSTEENILPYRRCSVKGMDVNPSNTQPTSSAIAPFNHKDIMETPIDVPVVPICVEQIPLQLANFSLRVDGGLTRLASIIPN